jgi:hypothetical protein
LGELPNSLSIAKLLTDVKDLIDGRVGVDCVVNVHHIESSTNYSVAEYTAKELERKERVKSASSLYKSLNLQVIKNNQLETSIAELEKIIVQMSNDLRAS